jgi:endonuclease/exonuclease/phosphatase family metal-dependent hydrolase
MSTVLGQERKPDVILGDFNEQPGGPLGDFLKDSGYADAAVLTGRQTLGTTPKSRRGDQIWVTSELIDQVRDYGVIPEAHMRTDLPGKEHLSDHFPLWVDLAI